MWSLNQSITHKFLSVEKNMMTEERFMLRNSAMLSSLVSFRELLWPTCIM